MARGRRRALRRVQGSGYVGCRLKKAGLAVQSAFKIEVRFLGGLSPTQKGAFAAAADRWSRVIVGDLPSVLADGEVIDDLLILAQGKVIDGPDGVLGQAGPHYLRPDDKKPGALLPVLGEMTFDSADLAAMEAAGTLGDVIAHEMGHVLGIGTVWEEMKLLKGAQTSNPTFRGKQAVAEYLKLTAGPASGVPVENTGGPGTRDGHWRESVFRNELMSGWIAAQGNPLSRMTVASLADMGYAVDLKAAEPYALPNLHALAASGALVAAEAAHAAGHLLPLIPTTLPSSAWR